MPDWLQLARDSYSVSTQYFDASVRPEVEAAIRQFQGVHGPGSKYSSDAYRGRSRLYRPKTRATIRKNEATAAEALFSTYDVINLRPEDDTNPMAHVCSDVMQALMQYRLTKSIPWFHLAMASYQEAQVAGYVISKQYWDFRPSRGIDKPCIDMIPPENFRLDSGANWQDPVNTSPYTHHLMPMYVKDVKARSQSINGLVPKWKSLNDAQIMAALKPYGDTTRLLREGQRTDPANNSSPISDFAVVWVHEVIMEWNGRDYVYHTLGTEVLLDEPKPIEQVYWTGDRPYVVGIAVVESHRNNPSGVARITRDVQAEINEVANGRMDNVKYALNPRHLVRRDRQVDLRALISRNVPGSAVLVSDTETDVRTMEIPDVTASSYQEQDRLNLDFDDMAGAFSGSSVQSNRKLNETVGGMNILTTNANQISGYQLRTWVETWVEPVLRQLLKLERHYETDDKILALAGKQAQIYKQGFKVITDEMMMQDLVLNVAIGMGATNPQDQVQNFMNAMTSLHQLLSDGVLQQYNLNVQEVVKEIFGKLGYRDGSRFFGTMDQEDPRIAELQGQVQQLQQQLDQKQPQELVEAQVMKIYAEIEKMRSDVMSAGATAAAAAVTAAETVAAVPETAAIADNILQTSAAQQPSNIDSAAPEESVERESAMKPEPAPAGSSNE